MDVDSATSARWESEARFFDRRAEQALGAIRPADPRTLRRYGVLRRRRFAKEFCFRLLGDLAGRSVLDVGCGDGANSITLAKLGAHATGIDISPRAIELARRRAEVNGVADRTKFIAAPLERVELPDGAFDVVWGDAILHHLIAELDSVLARLTRWARPGGLLLFTEPVNLSPALRALRMKLPIPADATPDERPLEPAEIAVIRKHIPDLGIRHFGLLDRVTPFLLRGASYEGAPLPRRAAVNAISVVDFALLAAPPLRRLAGKVVLFGHTGTLADGGSHGLTRRDGSSRIAFESGG